MNSISTVIGKSEFSLNEHLLLLIDDVPLDHILHQIAPERQLNGMVPSIPWLSNGDDRDFAIRRLTGLDGQELIAPILVCPDEEDLSCTLVVVEISFNTSDVIWSRLGVKVGPKKHVGNKVDWILGVGPYIFARQEYDKAMHGLVRSD